MCRQLNKSAASLLKTASRASLVESWRLWTASRIGHAEGNADGNADDTGSAPTRLGASIEALFAASAPAETVVVVLHEDYTHELPVFGERLPGAPELQQPKSIIFVLGAVCMRLRACS